MPVQPVKVTLTVRKNGEDDVELISTDDGKLIVKAILYGQKADGSLIPIRVNDEGELIVKKRIGEV